MAIQKCIDIAAHIISDEGLGVPGSTNQMFYLLEKNGYLHGDITEKMVKSVGFRMENYGTSFSKIQEFQRGGRLGYFAARAHDTGTKTGSCTAASRQSLRQGCP